ncbi:hypothetical protein HHK36_001005 [Tetracentron sinense]|uniref:3'-5' exonuclease domain-containing protein n=1 Tax=Tetracentron sinense TaxID=13715 RepID=A0A835A221_TETSI|nr:hypothetical protein HHK36_001005 [Tetracentron sinense]
MTIGITDLECPSETHQLYEVTFFSDRIQTLLTHTPALVDSWIANIRHVHRHRINHLIVGLDVEWRPSFSRNIENPVAILQLCVGRSCLIFQLLYASSIPPSLVDFLNNPNFTFVGVGIEADVEKLLEDYGLQVSRRLDLRGLASTVLNMRELRNAGLKGLAKEVLDKDVEKPRRVTMSRWDAEFLTYAQVQYACVDAFLSFEMGRSLISRNQVQEALN